MATENFTTKPSTRLKLVMLQVDWDAGAGCGFMKRLGW
ncbi:hypothetical protein CLIM01_03572 [Colletotrichum limetticola]|uniref:Uncharacterized protein n=1 Tax=Colletotrichum limetticola TaxID=1209924 RepID=A0ABQ9Q5T7_9PEZI|nr:hypothetical protein CLIM01_03572 [Colletotrichum limetticola]